MATRRRKSLKDLSNQTTRITAALATRKTINRMVTGTDDSSFNSNIDKRIARVREINKRYVTNILKRQGYGDDAYNTAIPTWRQRGYKYAQRNYMNGSNAAIAG